jgi:hypothetical protein
MTTRNGPQTQTTHARGDVRGSMTSAKAYPTLRTRRRGYNSSSLEVTHRTGKNTLQKHLG